MLASGLMMIVIHQFGFYSAMQGDNSPDAAAYMKNFFYTYGGRFITFGHGALHGRMTALFFALPIIGSIALFERRRFKYVAIHVGCWFVTMLLMGGVLCAFLQIIKMIFVKPLNGVAFLFAAIIGIRV